MVVHVYHPYRQPESPNHCLPLNGQCSHICLPAPQINKRSAKTLCACPLGLRLKADRLNCENDRKEQISYTIFINKTLVYLNLDFNDNLDFIVLLLTTQKLTKLNKIEISLYWLLAKATLFCNITTISICYLDFHFYLIVIKKLV